MESLLQQLIKERIVCDALKQLIKPKTGEELWTDLPLVSTVYTNVLLVKLSDTAENNTYSDDDKIQPTPGVCKVMFETKRKPLYEHFQQEYDCEHFIHIL